MDIFHNAMLQVHGFQIRHFFKKGKYYRVTIWCNSVNLTAKFARQLGIPLTNDGQIDITNNYEMLSTIIQHLEIVGSFYNQSSNPYTSID